MEKKDNWKLHPKLPKKYGCLCCYHFGNPSIEPCKSCVRKKLKKEGR